MIGGAVGGGYDLAGRTVAHHIGRHIPGNPGFVVRNMPGATSLIMTNHLYNVAKRDGTVIGMPTSNIPLEQRLKLISADGANVKFEIERLHDLRRCEEFRANADVHTNFPAPAQRRRRKMCAGRMFGSNST